MASRQYENFKNPVLQTRADRNQLNNQRMNTYSNEQQLFARDPWFAFGRTVGQALADNYNDRGIAKGMNEMQGVFNSLGQPQQAQQQAPAPTTMQGDMANAVGVFDQNNPMLQQPMANPNASLRDIMAQEKRDYRASLYADSDNPATEAIQNKNDIKAMDQAGNNLDFGQLNKEEVREQVRQKLQENGRTPYQIEQVLGQFDRMYDSKEAKWHEAKGTDYLQKGINAMNGDNPDYNTAFSNLAAAAEHGNKRANIMLQQLTYLRNKQDKLDAENRAFNRQLYLKSFGGGRGGGVGTRGSNATATSGSGPLGSVAGNGAPGYGYRPAIDKDRFNQNQKILENPEMYGGENSPLVRQAYRENMERDGHPGYSTDYNTQRNLAFGVRQALHDAQNGGKAFSDEEALSQLTKQGLFTLPEKERDQILQETGLAYLRPTYQDDADRYAMAD